MVDEEPISPLQERAIIALLRNRTKEDAAAEAEVPPTTLYRWLREDERFKARYRQAQRELYVHAMGNLQDGMGEAVATLRAVMGRDEAPDTARVSAARLIIEFSRQHHDKSELEERMERLERSLDLIEQKDPGDED